MGGLHGAMTCGAGDGVEMASLSRTSWGLGCFGAHALAMWQSKRVCHVLVGKPLRKIHVSRLLTLCCWQHVFCLLSIVRPDGVLYCVKDIIDRLGNISHLLFRDLIGLD